MPLLVFDFQCPRCKRVTRDVIWEVGTEIICGDCEDECKALGLLPCVLERLFANPNYHQSDLSYLESAGRSVSADQIPPKNRRWV